MPTAHLCQNDADEKKLSCYIASWKPHRGKRYGGAWKGWKRCRVEERVGAAVSTYDVVLMTLLGLFERQRRHTVYLNEKKEAVAKEGPAIGIH